MTRTTGRLVLAALGVAAALATVACSAKVEVGSTTTSEQTSTTAARTTTTATTVIEAPPVGTTETVGPYTLEIVDPSEYGFGSDSGLQVTAAKITEGTTLVGALLRLTPGEGIVFTDEISQQVLSQVSGAGATPAPITVDGKSGYVTENADGQVIIGRATEEGDLGVVIGAPGITQEQLVDVLQAISS